MSTLYEERLERTMAAVRGETPDRVPISFLGTACVARWQGESIGRYCTDMDFNWRVNLKGMEMIGEPDSTHAAIYSPYTLPGSWLSQVEVPSVDFPDGELWQVLEKELMKQEEYDDILEEGFGPWYQRYLVERCGDPNARLAETGFFQNIPVAMQAFAEAGYPVINAGGCGSPFEMFCGARSLIPFLTEDLMGIPDKLDKVFQMTQEFNLGVLEQQLSAPGVIGIWVGGWRGTPADLSPEMFERFSWKYMRELAYTILEHDVIPIMHLDSNWDRGIEYFKEFPAHSIILHFDGMTDIFEARKVIGDKQCIMGDVPSTLLAFGSIDDVEGYCKKLIDEVGPRNYVLSSGCDTPYNAKLENVQAMVNSVRKFGKF